MKVNGLIVTSYVGGEQAANVWVNGRLILVHVQNDGEDTYLPYTLIRRALATALANGGSLNEAAILFTDYVEQAGQPRPITTNIY